MLPEFQTPFVVSCPKSCGCLGPVWPLPGTGVNGTCHPTTDMFSICDLLNYRKYKVKMNLTPFHKREFVIPGASFFHTHSWGPSLQLPSACLPLSMLLSLTSTHLSNKDTETRWSGSVCHCTQHVLANPHPLVLGPLFKPHGGRWDGVTWSCPGLFGAGGAPQAGLQAVPAGDRGRVPSGGAARLAGVCQRAPGCRDARATGKASAAKAGNKR